MYLGTPEALVELEAKVCQGTGFSRCEFEPDDMQCESCKTPGLQMYYRRTDYFCEEGQYMCLLCVAVDKALLAEDMKRFERNTISKNRHLTEKKAKQ